jgi:hypothetical protein
LAEDRTQQNPNEWRENILISDNYFHDIGSECLYVGANYNLSGQRDLPLRNIDISYNRVEKCVRDGINLKSTIAGTNRVHHNFLRDIGMGGGGTSTDRSGIAVFEGYADIFANRIESVYLNNAPSGGNCITTWALNRPYTYGPFQQSIYNNVCKDPENHGINVGRASSDHAEVRAMITHNTIVSPAEKGININLSVTGGVIRDNVIVNASGSAISAPKSITVVNNRSGTIGSQYFVDALQGDYRLTASSPARNGAVSCVAVDFAGTTRPQENACDQGAFEFGGEVAPTGIAPPRNLVVQ